MSIEHVDRDHSVVLDKSKDLYTIPVESPLKKVFDRAAFLAGPGAILSQVSNKKVYAGVSQHSNFDKNPIDRLYHTLKTTERFIHSSDAEILNKAVERIMSAHKRVQGQTASGEAYAATDSDLVRWVWATLAYGAVAFHQRLGTLLSEEELDAVVRDSQIRMPLLRGNISTFPKTYKELVDYMQSEVERGDIVVNGSTRQLKNKLFHPFKNLKRVTGKLENGLDILAGATMHPALRKLWFPNWGEKEEMEVKNLFSKLRSPVVIYQRVNGRK